MKSTLANEIWVLGEARPSGELHAVVYELAARARELADDLASFSGEPHAVHVLLILDAAAAPAEAESVGWYGADRAMTIYGERLPFDRAACAKILAHLGRERRPKIVIAPATAFGRSVMPYAAALLETGLTADCTGLSIDCESGLLLQTRPAIGGNIMATIRTPAHMPQMATVRPRTFRIPEPDKRRAAVVTEVELPKGLIKNTVRTVAFDAFTDDESALQEKEVVVSGGKGLRKAEGFELIARLASLLDAGVGASRPVVEMKWIGYPHQVGLSGQVVSPKVYIAAGISGTVQHLAGMQTSGKIVAINRDPDALIFNVADVALCGDLYEIIPLLIERIEARKGGAGR